MKSGMILEQCVVGGVSSLRDLSAMGWGSAFCRTLAHADVRNGGLSIVGVGVGISAGRAKRLHARPTLSAHAVQFTAGETRNRCRNDACTAGERRKSMPQRCSTRSVGVLIDTVVCLTLAKWETVSGRFGGYFNEGPTPAHSLHGTV
jgi:hypothetical protein